MRAQERPHCKGESALRSLEILPRRELRPYVRLYWLLELEDPGDFGPVERIHPDGLLELVFHFRDPVSCRYDGEDPSTQPRAVAVSQTQRSLEIHPTGPTGLLTVRFQPWGAWHFLRPPLAEFADQQVALGHLWGSRAQELQERLCQAFEDRTRIDLVETFLLAQLRRHSKIDVEPLVRKVWKHRGCATVAGLCDELGIGERRLQRLFADALGISPKHYSRLIRFLHSCQLLSSAKEENLVDVAFACGYYDQSHFTADFRAFAGLTPGRFVERSHEDSTRFSFLELD